MPVAIEIEKGRTAAEDFGKQLFTVSAVEMEEMNSGLASNIGETDGGRLGVGKGRWWIGSALGAGRATGKGLGKSGQAKGQRWREERPSKKGRPRPGAMQVHGCLGEGSVRVGSGQVNLVLGDFRGFGVRRVRRVRPCEWDLFREGSELMIKPRVRG